MNSLYEQIMTTLYTVWRKRWYGLAAMWAVCLAGWVAVAMIPNEYESSARIYVKWSSLLPNQLGFRGGSDKLQQIDIVRQTLTSRPNLEKVVRRAGLADGIESDKQLDALIADLTENVKVQSQQDNLFTISYISKSPSLSDAQNAVMAQRIVQNLINIFVEDNIDDDRDTLNQAIRFYDDQLAQRERELELAERRRAEFEQKYFGSLPGQGDMVSRLSNAKTELDRVTLELTQAQSSLRALNAQLASTPATIQAPLFTIESGGGFSGMRYDPTSARGRIEQLERQISEAYSRGWTDQHPDVVAARAQIERLRKEAAAEAKNPSGSGRQQAAQPNPVYANLRSLLFDKQSQVASLSARAAQLRQDIADLSAKQIQVPGIIAEQTKLDRDYRVLRAKYEELLKQREEVRIRSDVENKTDQVKFETVDPPTRPTAPVAPNRPVLLTSVLLAGIAAGVAVAFLLSQIHTTYVSTAKLQETLGLPVLGSVSEIVGDQQRAQNRLWLWGFAVLGVGLVGIYAALLLYELIQRGGAA